nr:hypothetical protein [Tanacetum cinerariifolium]
MVAFLSKPTESDGFEQIVDFLNARPIRYALTVNPTIYISCIEQFWSTAMAKTINNEAQLHAKVYGKKIIVTESSVRRDLRLANKEGIDYLLNSTIFEQIALMGVGKVFFGKATPLFQTMVQQLGEGSAIPTDPQYTPTIIQLSSSQPQKTQNPRKPTRKDTQVPQLSGPTKSVAEKAIHKELGDRLVRAATTASSLEAEQDSGNITKTQSKVTPNEPSFQETDLGGGLRVELSDNEESLGEDASKQEKRIGVIDADEGITLVSVQDDVDKEMFDVDALNGKEVFIAGKNENFVEEIVDAAQTLEHSWWKEKKTEYEKSWFKRLLRSKRWKITKKKDEPKQLMETIPDEKEVAIDAIPLAVKSPRIIDWKIRKEGKKSYYQIVRADGNSDVHNL